MVRPACSALAVVLLFAAPSADAKWSLRHGKLGRTGWSWRTDLIAADEDLALVDYLKRVQ